jgi:hypothetical protein
MAKIYVSLEFDDGDLTFSKELDDSFFGTERTAAFSLVLAAFNTYLQAFTPEMRMAWDDLSQIRHLFMLHTEELPVPAEAPPRVFTKGDIPRDVEHVTDRDGDKWHYVGGYQWRTEDDSVRLAHYDLVKQYGPLTEVLGD